MAKVWMSSAVRESVKRKKRHIQMTKLKEKWYNFQLVRDKPQGGATIKQVLTGKICLCCFPADVTVAMVMQYHITIADNCPVSAEGKFDFFTNLDPTESGKT